MELPEGDDASALYVIAGGTLRTTIAVDAPRSWVARARAGVRQQQAGTECIQPQATSTLRVRMLSQACTVLHAGLPNTTRGIHVVDARGDQSMHKPLQEGPSSCPAIPARCSGRAGGRSPGDGHQQLPKPVSGRGFDRLPASTNRTTSTAGGTRSRVMSTGLDPVSGTGPCEHNSRLELAHTRPALCVWAGMCSRLCRSHAAVKSQYSKYTARA